ncbi:MAG: hypothetical protein ACFFCM_01915 [Promethearchaeota archaeon]
MSQEEIKSQIIQKQNEITKLEETAVRKEQYITNRINEEFDPQLKEIEAELLLEKSKLAEVNKKIDQWKVKQKELTAIVKNLSKKYSNYEKEKHNYMTSQLKAIAKEKNTKIKEIKTEIKALEKELKAIMAAITDQ